MARSGPGGPVDAFGQSGAFCHLVVESLEDYAISALDTQGRFTGWNPGAERIFGYTRDEILGQQWSIIFTPEDLERGAHVAELETARREGKAADERWHVRKDGSRFWGSGITVAVRDEQGQLVGFAKLGRDLTESKLSTDALREEATRRAALATFLQELAGETLDPEALMRRLVAQAQALTHASGAALALREEDTLVYHVASGETALPPGMRCGLDTCLAGRALLERRVLRIDDTRAQPGGEGEARRGIRAIVAAPLFHGERGLGVLEVHAQEPGAFSEWDEESLELLVGVVANVLVRGAERQRLQAVLDALPVGVVIADAAGRLVEVNPAAHTVWGAQVPLLEHPDQYGAFKGWHPDTGRPVEPHEWGLARAIRAGETSGPEEVAIETFAGERKTILNFARPTRDVAGRTTGAVAVNVDITEHRRAQAEALETKGRLEAAIRASGLLYFDWATDTDALTYGGDIERFTGYRREELRGGLARWMEQVHPDDRARVAAEVERVRRTGEPIRVSYRYVRKDGAIRHAESHGYFLPAAPGRGAHVVGFLHDITERREAEERIRLLESVVTSANDAVMVTAAEPLDDPGPSVLYVNEAFSRATGYPAEEVLGKTPRVLQGPDTDRQATKRIREALERQEPIRIELLNYKKDGTPFWFDLNIVPVRDAEGRVTHFASLQRDTTERRAAEATATRLAREEAAHAEAEEARRQIATILESITDAFIAIDAQWRLTYVNRRAAELVGQTPEACVGRHVREVYPDVGGEELEQAMRQAMAQGASVQAETYVPRLGAWLQVHAYPSSGGLSVYMHDISERRHAEAVQRRLTAILEATPDLVATLDPRAKLLSLNRAGQRLLGPAARDALGRSLLEFLPEWAASRALREAIPAAIREGTWSGESAVLGPDGREVPVSQVFIAHRGPGGRVEYLSTVCRDIAERKRGEEVQRFLSEASHALSGSLEYEEVVRSVPGLLVPRLADFCILDLVDAAGEVRRVSLLHRDPEQREPLEALRRFPPRGGARLGTARVLRTGEPELVPEVTDAWLQAISDSDAQLEALHALHPRSELIVPLRARGRVIGAVSCVYAASGRGYREEDVPIIEDLAARAALALDNANLFRSTQQAVRARDEVLRIVAHDLRGPLNGISLGARALLKRLPPQEEARAGERKQLGLIQRLVERADSLIQDLLDVARMEAGKLSVEREPEDLGAIVRQALELHAPLAAEKGLGLEAERWEALPPVLADRGRLLQVLANLLGNALKFTPAGGRITVRCTQVDGEVRVTVSDTGPGIAPEQLPHLFEPFWQARGGTREGAGLGLTISRGIIDAHGGRLWVESEAGQGSTFTFSVPVAAAQEAAGPAQPAG